MTTIAVLGAGRVGLNLATALHSAGHTVTVGARGPVEAPAQIAIASLSEAAAGADIIINALPGNVSVAVLSSIAEELAGKVLIDIANATERGPDGLPSELLYPAGSLAEELQQALPRTRVVKTLNTMLYTVMTAPQSLPHPATAFLSGNDGQAKQSATALLTDLGWASEWILDLGDITTARAPEAFTLLTAPLLKAFGFTPFALTVSH
ncbi:NADPH-dependent F420 reductase [Nocardia sp. NBC_01327]|uniref:NADPH-dependent F420 reductase n=1 Tax=Nocardia sp. NBC_01327 TaxID=2903593 RepID=UPI002E11F701|nr:NAD(P)-binding domain-containing protein [Nocardia sp. NBC_01327]